MKETKKDKVLLAMVDMVEERGLCAGDRLPAERVMAEQFATSRATVREVLRLIEEKGFLKVVRGSGAYLNCDSKEFVDGVRKSKEKSMAQAVREYFELRYIFVAEMGRLAAFSKNKQSIEDMKDATVRMSVAVIEKNFDELIFEENRFFQIVSEMTGNSLFSQYMAIANKQHKYIWEEILSKYAVQNESLFAGFVKIYNSIKESNPDEAYSNIQESIMDILNWLIEIDSSYLEIRDSLIRVS